MALDVQGMALKCQGAQTLAWDVAGMVGPGCYNTWANNWAEELGCCMAWTRVNDACGCLRDGTSWMLNVLMDVSEKSDALS